MIRVGEHRVGMLGLQEIFQEVQGQLEIAS